MHKAIDRMLGRIRGLLAEGDDSWLPSLPDEKKLALLIERGLEEGIDTVIYNVDQNYKISETALHRLEARLKKATKALSKEAAASLQSKGK